MDPKRGRNQGKRRRGRDSRLGRKAESKASPHGRRKQRDERLRNYHEPCQTMWTGRAGSERLTHYRIRKTGRDGSADIDEDWEGRAVSSQPEMNRQEAHTHHQLEQAPERETMVAQDDPPRVPLLPPPPATTATGEAGTTDLLLRASARRGTSRVRLPALPAWSGSGAGLQLCPRGPWRTERSTWRAPERLGEGSRPSS